MIGRVRIVQIEALIQSRGDQQISARRADIPYLKEKAVGDLILCPDVPLMNERRTKVPVDRAKLKGLGDVAPDTARTRRCIACLAGGVLRICSRTDEHRCVVAYLINSGPLRGSDDSERPPAVPRDVRSAARERCRGANAPLGTRSRLHAPGDG